MEQQFPFQASQLPYSHVALMPYCDADTLYYHHDKYYAETVYELNRLAVQHRLTDQSLSQLATMDYNLPAAQLNRLRSAAGSVFNHQLYFDGIGCKAGAPPFNRLTEAISASYGSMDRFQQLLTEAAESIIGSGWVWLSVKRAGISKSSRMRERRWSAVRGPASRPTSASRALLMRG